MAVPRAAAVALLAVAVVVVVLAETQPAAAQHIVQEIDDPGAYMFTPSSLSKRKTTTTTTPAPETTTDVPEYTGTTDKDDKKVPDPSFVDEIENVTAPAGRSIKLSCTVKDLGAYRVAWMHFEQSAILTVHTHVITRNPRISVSHDNLRTWFLHIRDVQKEDRGRYMCQINTANAKTQIGYLHVVVPPSISDTQSSSDVIVRENANVSLACAASGSPDPVVKWKRDDNSTINVNKTLAVTEWEGTRLEMSRISRVDMGDYLCIASNGVPPTVSKRIRVSVDFPPMLQIPHQLVGAPLGSTVTLECSTEAHPISLNYWTREKDMIHENSKFHADTQRAELPYKSHMTLTIRNVEQADYGTYKCVAKNPRGETDGVIRLYMSTTPTTSPPPPPPTTDPIVETRDESSSSSSNNNNVLDSFRERDKGSKYLSSLNEINKSEHKSLDAGGKGPRQEWPPGRTSGCRTLLPFAWTLLIAAVLARVTAPL
ncbi:lachesin-like isoform X2 [Thrips palmi]|uniref:Lachesin-like isoform X2 n=1 Tax=Thrips palmi TaxID=161013 RepID=A0A6P8YV98_THRPL|nr:lachesin-like isoform X2 [Thrips palmi]